MLQVAGRYREYVPCEGLREQVRAFFTFIAPAPHDPTDRFVKREILFRAGEPFSGPLVADGHLSIVFSFATAYRIGGLWAPGGSGPAGHVIGAMSRARPAFHGDRIVQVGAYLGAAQTRPFLSMPACELTDRVVALRDFWHASASALEEQLSEAGSDGERISLIEAQLLGRVARARTGKGMLDLCGLAGWIMQHCGALSIHEIANAAGVSRQHLTRVFHEEVGMPPKLFSRLARFRSALALAGRDCHHDGAGIAAQMGYADQSHMIAEFRQFSGLTPGSFNNGQHFHPFV